MPNLDFLPTPTPRWIQERADNSVHEAGAWGLFLSGPRLDRRFPVTSKWLVTLLSQVKKLFPWCAVRDAEFGLASVLQWQHEEISVDDWLVQHDQLDNPCGGFVGNLDLELCWNDLDGSSGRSVFKKCGRILIDPNALSNSVDTEVFCSFLVNLNLFTNQISTNGDREINIQRAATENRSVLERSLRRWEAASGGTIKEWESSTVQGVCRYGFESDCSEK